MIYENKEQRNEGVAPSVLADVTMKEDNESFTNISMNSLTADRDDQVKVLGVPWDTEQDMLRYSVQDLMEYTGMLPTTKRSVLKLAARTFDPLGLITP